MSMRAPCLLLFALLVQVARGHEFLGANPELAAAAVRNELRGVLSEVLGHGHGVDAADLMKIRQTLSVLFRALPKNRDGRLSAPVMRYAVQRYFSKQHGWIVKGFEPHAASENVSDVADGSHILQSKLPSYVRSALEEKFSHHGFSLEDAAVMVAAVERLAFDEVVKGVEAAFRLNSLLPTESLGWDSMQEILSSYLIIEMLEGSADDISQHRADKADIHNIYPHWDDSFLFLMDVAGNDIFGKVGSLNPFRHREFTFEDVVRIAQRVSEEFGAFSNHECHLMKSALSEMDVHGTGRVRLSDFYRSSSQDEEQWQFRESSEYLRQLGALDESSAVEGPSVIIPNYISGMSNCVTSAPYYTICCLNECDKVYQHLETVIPASTASAAEIMQAVKSMPHTSSVEAKSISLELRNRLEAIEALNGGKVPLHGRLLAQWLHFTFPRECPYPHLAGTVSPQTPAQYEGEKGEEATVAGDDEVQQFLESEAARRAPSPEAGKGMWTLEEVLLEASTPSDTSGITWLAFVFTCVQVCAVGGFAAMVLKELSRALHVTRPKAKAMEYNV